MHLNIAEYPRELPSKVSIIMIKFSRSVATSNSVKYSKILGKNVPKPKHLENHLKLKDIFSTQSQIKIRLLNRLNISRSSKTRCFMCTEFASNESQKQKRKRKKTQNTSPGESHVLRRNRDSSVVICNSGFVPQTTHGFHSLGFVGSSRVFFLVLICAPSSDSIIPVT